MKYIATLIIDVDENCDGYKTDREMIDRFLKFSVKVGKIHESAFRGKVLLNVKDVKYSVIGID